MMPTYTDPYLEEYREKIRRLATEEPAKPAKGAFAGFAGEGATRPQKVSSSPDERTTPLAGFAGEGAARPENFADKPTEATAKSPRPTWRLAPIPPERQAEEARRRLEERGWCAVLARRIGDDAVLLLAADPAKAPATGYPMFTPTEIAALLPGGLPAFKAAYTGKLATLEGAAGDA